jgi:hypothetical protein
MARKQTVQLFVGVWHPISKLTAGGTFVVEERLLQMPVFTRQIHYEIPHDLALADSVRRYDFNVQNSVNLRHPIHQSWPSISQMRWDPGDLHNPKMFPRGNLLVL